MKNRLQTQSELISTAKYFNTRMGKDELARKAAQLRMDKRSITEKLEWIEIGMRGDGEMIFDLLCTYLYTIDTLEIANILLARK